MIKVGISGKIASGKSIVENILQELGYLVFDLDIISHDLLENNQKTKDEILKEFNTLDRKEISKIVFNNNEKKKKLENIIHPKLKNIIFDLFEKYKKEPLIFISGALLFKSNFDKFFDKTIFVDAKEDIRLERLMKRNNLTKENALIRLNSQDDNNATYTITNNTNIEDLKTQVENILKEINLQ